MSSFFQRSLRSPRLAFGVHRHPLEAMNPFLSLPSSKKLVLSSHADFCS